MRPRLSLFVKAPDSLLERLRNAFMSPVYAYVIGRSQDLATCLAAEMVELAESEEAFFSHTLLPYDWRQWVLPGTTVQMPKAINYSRGREPVFEVYLQVLWPPLKLYSGSQDTISRDRLPARFAVDESDRHEFGDKHLCRGLTFHPIVGPGAP
jgi:CRISPR-associated protein Cas5t